MELNFKDTKSKELFEEVEKLDLKQPEIEDDTFILDDIIPLVNKEDLKNISNKSKKTEQPIISPQITTISTEQLKRIESKQNAILEILECVPLPSVKQINLNDTAITEIDNLKLNLKLFNEKFIILSTKSNNKNIEQVLVLLQDISEHLLSNSFNIFTKDNSPIKLALKELEYIGIGDSILNNLIETTINVLTQINNFSSQDIFEQSYNYSNLLLEKGLILNAVTLFNESAGMYITQSAKSQSKEISKYIHLVGEQQCSKLYSQAKDFFINIFLDKKEIPNTISMFPHHKIIKEIDKTIEKKFVNIQTTWRKKGDSGVFEKYAYIVKRLRIIRNSIAHGNLEINFRSLTQEIQELNDDFYYLAIKKNILKR